MINDVDEPNGLITTPSVTNKKETITDLSWVTTTNLVSLQFMTRNTNRHMMVDVWTPCHQPQVQAKITVQCANVMKEALCFLYEKLKFHPLVIFLHTPNKTKSWLRQVEMKISTRLSSNEKIMAGLHHCMLCPLPRKEFNNLTDKLAHAWGISRQTLSSIVQKIIDNAGSTNKKIRNDAGKNLFNSLELQTTVFTPLQIYKKYFYDCFERIYVFVDARKGFRWAYIHGSKLQSYQAIGSSKAFR